MADNDYLWDPEAPSDPEIARIEEALRPLRVTRPELSFDTVALRRTPRRWPWAMTAAAVIILVGSYAVARSAVDPWAVRAVAGSASVANGRVDANAGIETRIAEGEWLVTDANSRVEINVGRIGRAEFGPGSRVQLVRAGAREHRLALARGTMHARIWAPPRFFLVETASALAVDLGCVYSLRIDDRGEGELVVESGEVELVEGTRRALIPAGNLVSVRPGVGPGLPVRRTASAEFRAAVKEMESALASESALARVLELSSTEGTITLWHLLQRVPVENRGRVYDRLTDVAAAPAEVGREATLALESNAMRQWKEALQDGWTTETVPKWKRAWRKAWTFLLTVG